MSAHPTHTPNMNSRDLVAIVAIAEYRSLVAASAYLKISQSALSRAVTRVESLVGLKLFQRSTRRVQPTAAGSEFVAVAERMLSDLHLALGNMRDIATEQRGQVIISAFSLFAVETLPPIIRRFRESRPQVHVHIRTGRRPDVLEDVAKGVADFGVAYGELPDTFEHVDLQVHPICVVVPTTHALARGRGPVRLEQLEDVAQVSLPSESYLRRTIDGAAAARRIRLNHAVTVTGFTDMMSCVRAGVGVGMLPRSAWPQSAPPNILVRPLIAPALSMRVSLFYLPNRNMSPAALSFRSAILEEVRGRGQTKRVARA